MSMLQYWIDVEFLKNAWLVATSLSLTQDSYNRHPLLDKSSTSSALHNFHILIFLYRLFDD